MGWINKIDWVKLRAQKAWLFDANCEEADGLLSLLDALQDHAVDVMGIDEATVFGED